MSPRYHPSNRILIGFALAGLGLPRLAQGESVTLTPIKDNTLYQYATGDTSNGAGPVFFAGENSQGSERRAVLSFDVGNALPPGVVVTGVELVLTVSNAPNDTVVTLTLHRLTCDWGEGTSSTTGGRGAPATTSDATWLYAFYPDQKWIHPGGDFGPARVSAEVPIEGTASWSGDALIEDVKAWMANPQQNFGWLLKDEESDPATARRFASREASNLSERPKLIIEYAPPDQVRFSSWGEQKIRWGDSRR